MLETEGKTSYDSYPNVKTKQNKTKPIHQLHFFYFTIFHTSLLTLALLVETASQSCISQRQLGGEKSCGVW